MQTQLDCRKHLGVSVIKGAAVAYGLFAATAVWAEPQIDSTYTLLSSATLGDGTTELTYRVTLTNVGDISLGAVALHSMDQPMWLPEPGTAPMSVESLAVSESISMDWTVTSLVPPVSLPQGEPIVLSAEGVDAWGDPVAFPVISIGGM